MSDNSRLRLAWKQLELENPDSTERLKCLRVTQELNNLIKQTQKNGVEQYKKENEREKNQEHINTMRKDQKQKEFHDIGHSMNLLHQIWLPKFMESFGDVKIVFMGGQSIWFYRSVLANISPTWKTLLEVCKETDTILLPGTEKGNFLDEAKNNLFCKEKTKHKVLIEGHNKRKSTGKEPLAIEPVVEFKKELEKTYINYDNTNERPNMAIKKPRKQVTLFCKVCLKNLKCRHLARHMWESHKIGESVNFQFPCKTVWNCGRTFTRAQTETAHVCRANASLFSITCAVCLKRFKSEKMLKNHRKNGTCQTKQRKLEKWTQQIK